MHGRSGGGGDEEMARGGEIEACHRLLSIHSRLRSQEEEKKKKIESKSEIFMAIETLYRDHPGPVWRDASRRAIEARMNMETKSVNLVYGEVSFVAFADLLDLCVPMAEEAKGQQKDGLVFCDLGCGAGRPVFIASLLKTQIRKSHGVEILSRMHQMNQELLRLYNIEIWPHLHPDKQSQEIVFIHGDFLEVDWSDADILFMNATCFDDPLFEKLERQASKILKDGTIVISVTRAFRGDEWEMVEVKERRMSWSSCMVYVYKKVTKFCSHQ